MSGGRDRGRENPQQAPRGSTSPPRHHDPSQDPESGAEPAEPPRTLNAFANNTRTQTILILLSGLRGLLLQLCVSELHKLDTFLRITYALSSYLAHHLVGF